MATGPNQVWARDITYLPRVRGSFWYPYAIIDVWSRKLVGCRVHEVQSDDFAAALIDDTCRREGVVPLCQRCCRFDLKTTVPPIAWSPAWRLARFGLGRAARSSASLRSIMSPRPCMASRGAFTRDEIGAVYASNWERDFSQGPREIADAALLWKRILQLDQTKDGDVRDLQPAFIGALATLMTKDFLRHATDTSFGGYQTWEHMDQPDGDAKRDADERWNGEGNGLAGYLLDTHAYIKDQMFEAVQYCRKVQAGTPLKSVDNWNGVAKPKDYKTPEQVRVANESGSADVLEPVSNHARRPGGGDRENAEPHKRGTWHVVGLHLGRAMHAMEDFWAHSNWVELALDARTRVGPELPRMANTHLETGTFGAASKAHALGHKLLALSETFRGNLRLLRRVLGLGANGHHLPDLLGRLHHMGEGLIAEGHKHDDSHSHAFLSKDQPGHGVSGAKFDLTLKLATEVSVRATAPGSVA